MLKRTVAGRDGKVLRFGLVGVCNTLIDFGILNLLVWMLDHPVGGGLLLCNAAAFGCANLNSYFGNKYWNFQDRRQPSIGQYGAFFWVSLAGLAINSLILWLIIDLMTPVAMAESFVWLNSAKLVATLASLTWNYFAYRQLVFLPPADSDVDEAG